MHSYVGPSVTRTCNEATAITETAKQQCNEDLSIDNSPVAIVNKHETERHMLLCPISLYTINASCAVCAQTGAQQKPLFQTATCGKHYYRLSVCCAIYI